jgi:hypothetical protein
MVRMPLDRLPQDGNSSLTFGGGQLPEMGECASDKIPGVQIVSRTRLGSQTLCCN